MSLIPLPYRILAGAIALLLALAAAYGLGRTDGKAHCEAKQARANAKAVAVMEKARNAIDALSEDLAIAEEGQDTEAREIVRESVRIIEKQSVAPCLTADAAVMLRRAAANANREPPGIVDGSSSEVADHAR